MNRIIKGVLIAAAVSQIAWFSQAAHANDCLRLLSGVAVVEVIAEDVANGSRKPLEGLRLAANVLHQLPGASDDDREKVDVMVHGISVKKQTKHLVLKALTDARAQIKGRISSTCAN